MPHLTAPPMCTWIAAEYEAAPSLPSPSSNVSPPQLSLPDCACSCAACLDDTTLDDIAELLRYDEVQVYLSREMKARSPCEPRASPVPYDMPHAAKNGTRKSSSELVRVALLQFMAGGGVDNPL